ncbi:ankyrin repeat-containing domain protein [Cunninghamella echinulata]|nr:ankyrin repeat-containing domain protein [Cunninghamella echinulata]
MSNKNYNTTATLLKTDKVAFKEFCIVIDSLQCQEIKKRIYTAMNKIIVNWERQHESLVNTLKEYEYIYDNLQNDYQIQKMRFDSTVQEMQYYKLKYETSLMIHSNNENKNNQHDHYNHSNSSNNNITNNNKMDQRQLDSYLKKKCYSFQSLNKNIHNNNNNYVIDDNAKFPNNIISSPLSSNSQINSLSQSLSMTEKNLLSHNEELEYGCGEGFWHTIARGKSDKEGVDSLVANYIKRGGKTNVANHTSTNKLVKEGYGLIHALIAIKNTSALKRVIVAGVNTHALPLGNSDQGKMPPLVLAAKLNYMNGIRLLVEYASTNILESQGPNQENALHAAAEMDALEIVDYLLHLCPNGLIDQVDTNGATPLHYACKSGKTRMIEYLVNTCGMSPNKTDHIGETPLHYAIRNRRGKAIVKLVSDLGAYPNTYVIKQVPTPLDLAKSGGLVSISNYLRKMGAKTVKEMEKTILQQQKQHQHQNNEAKGAHARATMTTSTISSSDCSIHSGKTSESNGSTSSLSGKSYVFGATLLMKSKLEELMSKQ